MSMCLFTEITEGIKKHDYALYDTGFLFIVTILYSYLGR